MEVEARTRFAAFAAVQGPRLHRLALLLNGGDWHDAQDAAQQALTVAYQHWARIDSIDESAAYVRAILVNGMGKRGRRREVSTPAVTEVASLDSALAAVEQQSNVVNMLAVLAPRQRAVVALRFAEDLSEAETARLLGISVGTVKSQTAKALATLRGKYPTMAEER